MVSFAHKVIIRPNEKPSLSVQSPINNNPRLGFCVQSVNADNLIQIREIIPHIARFSHKLSLKMLDDIPSFDSLFHYTNPFRKVYQ